MGIFLTIAAVISIIVGSILTVFSRVPKETIANQKELIDSQEKRIKILEDQHLANSRAIDRLEEQVAVLKTIPLKDIAEAQKAIVETQKEIITLLQEK